MQRRAFLKLGGAGAALAGVATAGCGGDDYDYAQMRGDFRHLNYDDRGNLVEWFPTENEVRLYDANNRLQWQYTGQGTSLGALNSPAGVAFLDQRIYVSDFGNSRVVVLDRQGNAVFAFAEAGQGNGQALFVHEPVAGPDGNLYFCDALNHRVQVFRPDGTWLRSIGQFGTEGFGLNYPESQAFDAQGNLHVADSGNGRVVVFNSAGQGVRTYGSLGTAPGQMLNPEGIAIDPYGYVYVADKGQHLVQIYDRQGAFQERRPVFLPNGDYGVPGDMVWRPDGVLHVTCTRDASEGLIPRQYL